MKYQIKTYEGEVPVGRRQKKLAPVRQNKRVRKRVNALLSDAQDIANSLDENSELVIYQVDGRRLRLASRDYKNFFIVYDEVTPEQAGKIVEAKIARYYPNVDFDLRTVENHRSKLVLEPYR